MMPCAWSTAAAAFAWPPSRAKKYPWTWRILCATTFTSTAFAARARARRIAPKPSCSRGASTPPRFIPTPFRWTISRRRSATQRIGSRMPSRLWSRRRRTPRKRKRRNSERAAMLTCDDYLTPGSLDEAFDLMAAHRGRHRIIAGATDTLPWAREGRAGDVHFPVLIDITKIPELREISMGDRRARLGAATPIQRLLDNHVLAHALPAMPRCAVWFADDQIRAQATIGGNIVNASPAADATPCLIAHEAEVELGKKSGSKIARRRVKLD